MNERTDGLMGGRNEKKTEARNEGRKEERKEERTI
jgi:hypothetical protein